MLWHIRSFVLTNRTNFNYNCIKKHQLLLMKTSICLLILSLFPLQFKSQTLNDSTKTALECDSIILNSGETMTCLIQEIQKRKITYFICCDVCAVPRDIKRELVDTIILSSASKKRFYPETTNTYQSTESDIDSMYAIDSNNNIDSQLGHNIKILMLKKKSGNQKTILIKKRSHVKVLTKLNEVIEGKLSFGNNDAIYIGNKQIFLKDIKTLTKSSKGWKIAGGIIGSTGTLFTTYLLGFSLPVIFVPISATPFLLMLIKKKYDLENDYEIYYLH